MQGSKEPITIKTIKLNNLMEEIINYGKKVLLPLHRG